MLSTSQQLQQDNKPENNEFSDNMNPDGFNVDVSATGDDAPPSPPEIHLSKDGLPNPSGVVNTGIFDGDDQQYAAQMPSDAAAHSNLAAARKNSFNGQHMKMAGVHNVSSSNNDHFLKSPGQQSLYGGGDSAFGHQFMSVGMGSSALAAGVLASGDHHHHHGGRFGSAVLTEEDESTVLKQVEFNAKMMKYKLFDLLKMNVNDEEQQKNDAEMIDLKKQLEQDVTVAKSVATLGTSSSEGNLDKTVTSTASHDVSVSDVNLRHGLGGGRGTPHKDKGDISPRTAALQQLQHEKAVQLERIHSTVDTYFRFAFEEVALRWHSLQSRPFSLKVYHDTVKTEIFKRERAEHRNVVNSKLAGKLQEEVDRANHLLDTHKEAHELSLRQFYQELLVLRNRVADLQRKLGSHEPIPELLECDERASELADREARRRKQQEEDKHASYMYKRASEEVAILKHTLSERSNFIKALENELNTSRAEVVTTKSELRKYMEDQETIDAEFEELVAKSEAKTNQLERDNEALLNDLDARDSKISQLEPKCTDLLAQLETARNQLQSTTSALKEARELAAATRSGLGGGPLVDPETGAPLPMNGLDPAGVPRNMSSGNFRQGTDSPLVPQRSPLPDGSTSTAPPEGGLEAVDPPSPSSATSKGKGGKKLTGKASFKKDGGKNSKASAEAAAKFEEQIARLNSELAKSIDKSVKLSTELEEANKQKLMLHQDCETHLTAANAGKKEIGELKDKIAKMEQDFHRKETHAEIERRNERAFLKKKNLDLQDQVNVLEKDAKERIRANRKIQSALVDDVMNLHRQMSIAEEFMARYIQDDQLEILQRRLEGEHVGEEVEKVHTPRTLHYFSSPALNRRRVQEKSPSRPDSASLRAETTEGIMEVGSDVGMVDSLSVATPSHQNATPASSTGTSRKHSFPTKVDEIEESSTRQTSPPPAAARRMTDVNVPELSVRQLAAPANFRKVFTKSNVSLGFVKAVQQQQLEDEGIEMEEAAKVEVESDDEVDVKEAPAELEVLNLKMIIEDLLSQHMVAKATHDQLKADYAAFVEKYNENLEEQRRKEAEAPPAAMLALAQLRGVNRHSRNGSRAPSSRAFMDSAESGAYGDATEMDLQQFTDYRSDDGESTTSKGHQHHPHGHPPRPATGDLRLELQRKAQGSQEVAILEDFPGVEHASEFFDLFESFQMLRMQLLKLVDLCVAEAHRGALDPQDLERMKVILNDKFIAFRAIETHAGGIVNKLHKKKEDILRRREEELELVLQSMQNISLTHPREAQQLLRVAKQAQVDRAKQITSHSAGEGAVFAVEVQRPATAMQLQQYSSTRRSGTESPEVTVAGTPALMSVRRRVGSASVTSSAKSTRRRK